MSDLNGYAATLRINDQLVATARQIRHEMSAQEAIQVARSLQEIADALRLELEAQGGLTPERAAKLDAVAVELKAATTPGAGDLWAGLSRAHGFINAVITHVMLNMGSST